MKQVRQTKTDMKLYHLHAQARTLLKVCEVSEVSEVSEEPFGKFQKSHLGSLTRPPRFQVARV